MPIDLSLAGYARPYPPRGLRFLPWFCAWLVVCVAGAAISIYLWPKGTPAIGFSFWLRTVGIPNVAFLAVLSMARVVRELQWWWVHHWNNIRGKRVDAWMREAQRPLQVLGAGYSLPLQEHATLVEALEAGKPLVDERAPREGAGLVCHNRFDDDNLSVIPAAYNPNPAPNADDAIADESETVHTVILKLMDAITPLVPSLEALSQYGPHFAPAVRVLAPADPATTRLAQVKDAVQRLGLPTLDCQIATAGGALTEADVWLDQREWRALLLVAAEWHDAATPFNSTEGCAAVLLNPGCFELPEPVKVAGILHRPVSGTVNTLDAVFGNAVVWGDAANASMVRAWITGLPSRDETVLLPAFKQPPLVNLGEADAQRRVDAVVGNAGSLNALLSIAAAIESCQTGAHFIVDRAQAAVLHVTTIPHDESEQ
ncbi:hypothetical protein LMG23992_02483 [Cupriavidus laharis]|uniref:Type VI secretion protein n=1 Tax=Cupriavidus laharis TaxID=151654 RepID=A0ABN7YMA7_9BURK|nr:hypothetical protein [Cupriavidus laharis]CAG9173551.1 hypothetical protein LMG23992_02483 [Cupriavidus laharis]